METFSPPGNNEPDTDPGKALQLLQSRSSLDLSIPYREQGDRRHDLAVVAVDLMRRLNDLLMKLANTAELDMVVLDRLVSRARKSDDFTRDEPGTIATDSVPVLIGRAQEVDRALRLVVVAYKQAWFTGVEAGPA